MEFVYGKLPPHPEDTHPRVHLCNHLTPGQPPAVVDWASRVLSWPMYLNNRLGDCTCAALGHALEAWSTYALGTTLAIPDSDVLDLYERVSGYDPQTGTNDNGAVEQDVLEEVRKNGIGGHRILAYAQVDHKNFSEMKQALDMFGTVYLGFQVPQSAEDQFGQGLPWTVVPGSPVVGGHAIDLQKWDTQYMYPVTWGKLQPMDETFWMTYGDEAWVIITEDWLNGQGKNPLGLDLESLLSEFHDITGASYEVKQQTGWLADVVNFLKRIF
jgi:hypothetical protein